MSPIGGPYKSMQAIILTGGNGALLRPLTFSTPKPLLPLLNQPILQYIIRLLIQQEASEIIVAANYRSELVFSWINQQQWPVPVRGHAVDEYRGSAQVLWDMRDQLAERFLVIFADTLVDLPMKVAFDAFSESGAAVWMGLSADSDPFSPASLRVQDGVATALIPGPLESGSTATDLASDGRFYFLTRDVITQYGETTANIFPDVASELITANGSMPVVAAPGFWSVLGRLEPYLDANFTLLSQLGISYVDPRATVHPSAVIHGPALIGPDCHIGENSVVGPYVVMGPNIQVGSDTTIQHSMVFTAVRIGAGVHIDRSVIGFSATVEEGVSIAPLCIVGAYTCIGANSKLASGSRVGPNLSVAPDSHIADILFPPDPLNEDNDNTQSAQYKGLAAIEYDVFRVISLTGDITAAQIALKLDLPSESVIPILSTLVHRSLLIRSESGETRFSVRP